MSTRVVSIMLAFLLFGSAAIAKDKRVPAEPGVRVAKSDRVTRIDAVLGGILLSYALPRDAAGRTEFVLLVRPGKLLDRTSATRADSAAQQHTLPPCPADEPVRSASEPLALYRLDGDRGQLALLRDDLPYDADSLDALDLDGDGRDELVLVRRGELMRLDRESSIPPLPLVEDPALGWSQHHAWTVRHAHLDPLPWVAALELGSLSLYAPSNGSERWGLLARVELPLEADVDPNGIEIRSPDPRLLGRNSEGTLFFASPPQSFGNSRVQTTLVAVKPTGEASITDCWARLPEPEEVLGSSFLFVDDRPMLLVTTRRADKLNLFGEKRLRVYPLERDRSRLGLLPFFATQTRMNLWQEGEPMMLDVNDDGRDDIVIGYWKGVVHDRVVLDAYLRRPDGSFDRSARNTAFDVRKGDRSFVQYGADLTGDGIPDLLVRGKPGLYVYPGRASKNGKRLVEEKPRVIRAAKKSEKPQDDAPWWFGSETSAPPRIVDIDGDGIHEILMIEGAGGHSATHLRILRLTD